MSGSTLGAGVLSFVSVVGAGSFLIAPRGGLETGRACEYAPVDAGAALPKLRSMPDARAVAVPVPARVPAPATSSGDGMIRPVLGGGGLSEGFAGSLRLVKIHHLGGSQAGGAAWGPLPSGAPAAPVASSADESESLARQKPSAPPRRNPARGGSRLAAGVHYGVNSRVGLMSRGAGPVYNFGRALRLLDEAPLAPSDKATLRREFDRVRAGLVGE